MIIPDLVLAPRRFLLRNLHKILYPLVARRFQIALAAAGLLGAAWLAYATVQVVISKQIIAGMREDLTDQRIAQLDLLSKASEYHEQFTRLTRDLEDNQAYLLSLLVQDAEETRDLTDLEGQLRNSRSERARLELARSDLRREMEGFQAELSGTAATSPHLADRIEGMLAALAPQEDEAARLDQARVHLGQQLDQTRNTLAEVQQARSSQESKIERLTEKLARAESTGREMAGEKAQLTAHIDEREQRLSRSRIRESHLEEQVADLEASLDDVVGLGERLKKDRAVLNARIAGMEIRLAGMRGTHQELVDRLSKRSLFSIDRFENAIAVTGIDVNSLFPALPAAAGDPDQGGPFIPSNYVSEGDSVFSLQESIALLDLQIDRWENLQAAVGALPLAAPLEEIRITSGFGSRLDPFTGGRSSHHGLDLGAALRTEVLATAAGEVVFAGWRGQYGRSVEVDHGFGIRTRYGHLRKILVKVGQQVSGRETIGLVGSSGRSTGPHLHYEVRVKDKPLDPTKFLSAGRSDSES